MEFLQLQSAITAFTQTERELLVKVVNAVHAMKYGSVTITVHEGRLVEIHKTERIRLHR